MTMTSTSKKFYIIDAHCHIYPEKIADRAVNSTDTFYGAHSLCKGTVKDLISQGDKAGIGHYIVQSVATAPKQVRSINEFIADEVEKGKGRLTGFGTLHPESEDIEGDMEHLMELGLKGVKLHPDIQRFEIDNTKCNKIYELCTRYNMPILMHCGDSRYDYSNPDRMLHVLKSYSDLIVIGAHFGGWSVWEEACSKLHGIPNFYVDSSSTQGFIESDRVGKLIEGYGPERILFGTDYPMWEPEKEIEALLKFGLTDDEYRHIFSLNAKHVLDITGGMNAQGLGDAV